MHGSHNDIKRTLLLLFILCVPGSNLHLKFDSIFSAKSGLHFFKTSTNLPHVTGCTPEPCSHSRSMAMLTSLASLPNCFPKAFTRSWLSSFSRNVPNTVYVVPICHAMLILPGKLSNNGIVGFPSGRRMCSTETEWEWEGETYTSCYSVSKLVEQLLLAVLPLSRFSIKSWKTFFHSSGNSLPTFYHCCSLVTLLLISLHTVTNLPKQLISLQVA